MNEEYILKRGNRQRLFLRFYFGVSQMTQKPLLNMFLSPIIIGTVFLWLKKDAVYALFDVPHFLFPIYHYTILALLVLLPLICIFFVIIGIANVLAQKDEANVQNAFNPQELRNGCPILMSKKRIKGSNVTMREFYSSSIPMKVWVKKQEDIADSMNVHFVESLRYGGKSNGRRIVMYTAPGRETILKGIMYDDEF